MSTACRSPTCRLQGADAVIGDRAYGTEPGKVAAIAGAIADGLLAGGVLPVLKHLPGHGRATADSHHRLPVVDTDRATLESTDFAAFKPLANLPLGMTAHVVFSAIDPVAPATTSVTMVQQVIRGFIGFQGLLMSDDISMGALSGTLRRAQPRGACRRLRRRASLQRRPRGDDARSRASCPSLRATPRPAPRPRWTRAARRKISISPPRARLSPRWWPPRRRRRNG